MVASHLLHLGTQRTAGSAGSPLHLHPCSRYDIILQTQPEGGTPLDQLPPRSCCPNLFNYPKSSCLGIPFWMTARQFPQKGLWKLRDAT